MAPIRIAVTAVHSKRRATVALKSKMNETTHLDVTRNKTSANQIRSSNQGRRRYGPGRGGRGGREKSGRNAVTGSPGVARLFVGLQLPSSMVRQIYNAVVRSGISNVEALNVQPENIYHVTLHFLGTCDVKRAQSALTQVAEARNNKRSVTHDRNEKERSSGEGDEERRGEIEVTVKGVGAFPNMRDPRVLWMGVQANEALVKLHREIGAALRNSDISVEEGRDFHPHITLARIRYDNRRSHHHRNKQYRPQAQLFQNQMFSDEIRSELQSASSSSSMTGGLDNGSCIGDISLNSGTVNDYKMTPNTDDTVEITEIPSALNAQTFPSQLSRAGGKSEMREMAKQAVAKFVNDFDDFDAGVFRASEVTLYESVQGRGTPVYEVRGRFPL